MEEYITALTYVICRKNERNEALLKSNGGCLWESHAGILRTQWLVSCDTSQPQGMVSRVPG